MAAITPVTATNFAGSTTTSDTFVDASCTTAALSNGVTYLVLVLSSLSTEGAFPSTSGVELEARFGTTRYAVCGTYGYFNNFNAGDSANGGIMQAAFTVTGDGSSTINLRVRRNGGSDTIRWGGSSVVAIPLDQLVLNTDYFVAEATNSDTAEVTAAGAAFVSGAGGGQLSITPATTGDYLLVYSAEAFLNGTPDAGGEQVRARCRLDSTTICTETETTLDLTGGFEGVYSVNLFGIDVRSLTGSTTYALQWQFANNIAGDSIGYRRSRVYAIRTAAFRDFASIVNGGGVVANNADDDAANALSWNFGSSIGTLVLAGCSHQNGGAFGQAYLRDGTTNYPTDGYVPSITNTGTTSGDDSVTVHFMTAQTLSGAQSWFLRGHSDSAADLTFGRNVGNSADSRAVLVAIDLFVESGTDHTGSGTLAGSGTHTGNAALAEAASGTLASAGAHTGSSVLAATASGTLAGVGAQTGSAGLTITSAGSLLGVGALSGAGALSIFSTAILSGVAELTGSATVGSSTEHTASGTLASASTLAGSASLSIPVSGSLAGVGELSGAAVLAASASGSLLGAGTVTGSASIDASASGALAAENSLSGSASLSIAAAGSLLAESVLVGSGSTFQIHDGSGTLSGVSAQTGSAQITHQGAGSLLSGFASTAAANIVFASGGSLIGVGSLTGSGSTAALAPTVNSITAAQGHPTGGYLVEILGSNFQQQVAPPATGPAPVPLPSVRVEFGGVASTRVVVISTTRMLVVVPKHAMPVSSSGTTLATLVVDVVVTNLDTDGTDLGSTTVEDGFTYNRPDVSGQTPSMLTTLIKYLITMLRGEVTAEVVSNQNTDYDSDVSTLIVEPARLPQVIISGPEIDRNGLYTDNVGVSEPLANALEFRSTRRPYYCDLKFDLTVVANTEIHLYNLMSLITTVIDRSSMLTVNFGGALGTGRFPLDWDEGLATSKQSAGLNSNVRLAKGTIVITGFPFLEIPGTANDASTGAGMETEDVPSLQAAEQIGDNLPAYQGRAVRSPGQEDT